MKPEEYIAAHPTLSDSDKRYIMAFGVPSGYETAWRILNVWKLGIGAWRNVRT